MFTENIERRLFADVTASITVFEIPSAWAAVRNAHCEMVHEDSFRRLVELGLPDDPASRRRFDATAAARLASYAYPSASRDRLTLCNDFLSMLFVVDDQIDEAPDAERLLEVRDRGKRLVAALRTGRASEADLRVRVAVDLNRRLGAIAPRGWMQRFCASVEQYLLRGAAAGAEDRLRGEVPDLARFAVQRAHDAAVYPCQDLIELATDDYLPSELIADPLSSRARTLCTKVVAFTNDLLSYHKDVHFGTQSNVVRVLMAQRGETFSRAALTVIGWINRDVRSFEAAVTGLRARHPRRIEAIERYAVGQRGWMRGNLDWSVQSDRYRGPDAVFAELRPSGAVPPPAGPTRALKPGLEWPQNSHAWTTGPTGSRKGRGSSSA